MYVRQRLSSYHVQIADISGEAIRRPFTLESRRSAPSRPPLSNQTRAEHPSPDRDRGESVGLFHRIALSSTALRHKP